MTPSTNSNCRLVFDEGSKNLTGFNEPAPILISNNADVMLCSLHLRDKFLLFVDASIDPVTFNSARFDARMD